MALLTPDEGHHRGVLYVRIEVTEEAVSNQDHLYVPINAARANQQNLNQPKLYLSGFTVFCIFPSFFVALPCRIKDNEHHNSGIVRFVTRSEERKSKLEIPPS